MGKHTGTYYCNYCGKVSPFWFVSNGVTDIDVTEEKNKKIQQASSKQINNSKYSVTPTCHNKECRRDTTFTYDIEDEKILR